MAFKIVTDMPMPSSRHTNSGKGRPLKYDFASLAVGSAMIFDAADEGWRKTKRGGRYHIACNAAQFAMKRHGVKLARRRLPDGSLGIWRTA